MSRSAEVATAANAGSTRRPRPGSARGRTATWPARSRPRRTGPGPDGVGAGTGRRAPRPAAVPRRGGKGGSTSARCRPARRQGQATGHPRPDRMGWTAQQPRSGISAMVTAPPALDLCAGRRACRADPARPRVGIVDSGILSVDDSRPSRGAPARGRQPALSTRAGGLRRHRPVATALARILRRGLVDAHPSPPGSTRCGSQVGSGARYRLRR